MILCKDKGSIVEIEGTVADIATDIMTVIHRTYNGLLEEDELKAKSFKLMVESGLSHCLCTTDEAMGWFEKEAERVKKEKKEKDTKIAEVLKELGDLVDDDETKKSIDELIELIELMEGSNGTEEDR